MISFPVHLKNAIDKLKNKLITLESQWTEVRSSLIEQRDNLLQALNDRLAIYNDKLGEINDMKSKGRSLINEIKDKDEQLVRLQHDYETHKSSTSKNDHSRSFFTKQILEIVTNTNKQKEEINKTIIETRVLQKDLNRLTEKLERTFHVTDSQLFKVNSILIDVLFFILLFFSRTQKPMNVLDVPIKC